MAKIQILWAVLPALAFAGTNVQPRLSLTAEERYDDALAGRSEATPGVEGEASVRAPEAELMTKLSPRIGLDVESRTFESTIWYTPDFQVRHLSGRGDIRVDHRGGLNLSQRFSDVSTLRASAALWRVSEPTSLPKPGLGTRGQVFYGTGELGLESMLSPRTILNTRYRFEGAYFYEPGIQPSAVNTPSLELWYRPTRRASVGLEYRFQHFIFGPQRATAHAPSAMFRYRLTPFANFNARGGPVWFNEAGAQAVMPRVHLEFSRDRRGFELGAQAGQEVVGASGYATALWAQYLGVYSALRISEPFRIFGGAYVFRNGVAPGTQADWTFSGAGDDRDSGGYAVGAGMEWRFHRQLALQLQLDRVDEIRRGSLVGEERERSAEAESAFERNIAAIRLVMTAW